MTGALYPASMAAHGPCRPLPELRLQLIARRLDLLRQQLDAKNTLAQIGREIEAITERLRVIETAEIPVVRVIGSLDGITPR